MNESLFSLACPNCGTNLVEVALMRLGFITASRCPFCGSTVYWERHSLFLTVLGLAAAGAGAYLLLSGITYVPEQTKIASVMAGVGIVVFLLGIISFRFREVRRTYHREVFYSAS